MMRRRQVWGWGCEDQQPPRAQGAERAPPAAPAREHLGFGPERAEEPVPLEAVELPPPRLEPPKALAELCSSDPYERALHSHGSSYRDVVRAFRGQFDHPPDVVARPRDEDDLGRLLDWGAETGAAAIPYGGGTSVVGGVEPAVGEGYAGSVSLDMGAMDALLDVDRDSLAARIQAGATGPQLEAALREHGLTLRHFPQSFELATLGGWIATRAGGHFATGPTHIDDLVEAVHAVTPRAGAWSSRRLPASDAGPSPDRMLLGSEGTLAVITEAWVRVQPRPRHRRSAGVRFADYRT